MNGVACAGPSAWPYGSAFRPSQLGQGAIVLVVAGLVALHGSTPARCGREAPAVLRGRGEAREAQKTATEERGRCFKTQSAECLLLEGGRVPWKEGEGRVG
jgi:hypothetical protein